MYYNNKFIFICQLDLKHLLFIIIIYMLTILAQDIRTTLYLEPCSLGGYIVA